MNLLALAWLVAFQGPTVASEVRWAGTYQCAIVRPSNEVAELVVTPRGAVYGLDWTVQGQTVALGIGLIDGDRLLVGFAVPEGFGLEIFHRDPEGLRGQYWMWGGDGEPKVEHCRAMQP